jgi:hypothetical protein
MFSLNIIKKQNFRAEQDEKLRLQSNFSVQEDGDVWIRHNGILKIYSGLDAAEFLASVKGKAPGEVNVIIAGLFKGTVAA